MEPWPDPSFLTPIIDKLSPTRFYSRNFNRWNNHDCGEA
jgi:hypothetical protein